ncbi:transposase [Streptomyces sp. NPDC056255]|uniref:transposase n=1 Tax=Streptomyces sp. NPDC056255 TaxID=3345764 RepID=UPI0035DF8C70
MRGTGERKQIAADLSLVLRGHVQPRHLQRPDPAWRRPKQSPLCRLRHGACPAQRPVAPLPYEPHEDHQGGEPGQCDDLRANAGFALSFPSRPTRPVTVGAEAYKQRNAVERCISRLKQWRGLAMRTDKLAIAYQAALYVAALLIWARA